MIFLLAVICVTTALLLLIPKKAAGPSNKVDFYQNNLDINRGIIGNTIERWKVESAAKLQNANTQVISALAGTVTAKTGFKKSLLEEDEVDAIFKRTMRVDIAKTDAIFAQYKRQEALENQSAEEGLLPEALSSVNQHGAMSQIDLENRAALYQQTHENIDRVQNEPQVRIDNARKRLWDLLDAREKLEQKSPQQGSADWYKLEEIIETIRLAKGMIHAEQVRHARDAGFMETSSEQAGARSLPSADR